MRQEFTVADYMRIHLMTDKVNEWHERRRSIGICRMYEDIWKKEWLNRKTFKLMQPSSAPVVG